MGSRTLHLLTAKEAASLAKPGRHADGGNLYLSISGDGRRRWVFCYRVRNAAPQFAPDGSKKPAPIRELGVGPAPGKNRDGLSLAEAREVAAEARALLRQGKDPITEKHVARARAQSPLFGTYADDYAEARLGHYKNEKHRQQWKTTLAETTAPIRGKLLREITAQDIEDLLKPIAMRTPETAGRVRGRIERVFNAAIAEGKYEGENPARLKGNMDERVFAKTPKPKRGNHAAMPVAEMPALIRDLRGLKSVSALALEFTILCAGRTSETIEARLPEINFEEQLWTIPAQRMKAKKEHIVPLCARAMEILRQCKKAALSEDAFLFPGQKIGKALSNMALLECLRGLRKGFTVHGFRSTFSDWAGDFTNHDRETREFALAHGISDKTEAAYRRSRAVAKRRLLMDDWQSFLDGGKVLSFQRPRKRG